MTSMFPESIGPYRILGALGRGGMGVVFRGVHHQTGRVAAVKTVRTEGGEIREGLRREIHALSRLQHPGIVRVLETGLEAGTPWYAMELLEGVTLRQQLRTWFQHGSAALDSSTPPVSAFQPTQDLPATRETVPTRETARTRKAGDIQDTLEVGTTAEIHQTAGVQETAAVQETGASRTANGREASEVDPSEAEHWWTFSLAVARGPKPTADKPALAASVSSILLPAAGGRLREVLTLARRLCETLAFLHGEGLVHRDLKPENILLRPDGRPMLVDFGLVARWPMAAVGSARGRLGGGSRESLDLTAVAAGTLAYMAPEQLRGELLDARSDLYSLGCLLYELLTGQRPFVVLTQEGLIQAHLNEVPVPPSHRVQGLDPRLDRLILGLLAKDPRQRLGFADVVAATLEGLGAEKGSSAGTPKPRAYLYRSGFAGRSQPLAELLRWVSAGKGGVYLLGGESGVGKTRLALELGSRLAAWGTPILAGEAVQELGGGHRLVPLGVLQAPLRAIADRGRRSTEEAQNLLGGRLRLLGAYEPALLDLPGAAAEAPLADLPANAARLRLFHALTETFLALARGGPTVLLLDDLQNADELSLSWLESLIRSRILDQAPLFVLGTYRSTEVHEGLQRVLDLPEILRTVLGRIEGEAVGSMIGDMLALFPPPAALVAYLEQHSEGNPFYVAEYLRAAVQLRLLDRDPQGHWRTAEDRRGWDDLALPASLRDLVLQHLSGLGAQALRLAQVAAVLGREVDARALQAVARMQREEVLEALQELVRRQVLEDRGTGPLRFTHDKLRELAYAGLSFQERRRWHKQAAQALQCVLPAARLGHHWEKSGSPARARGPYLQAAREALARHALGEAEQLYRAYLRLVRKPTPESITARNELGHKILLIRGQSTQAQNEQRLAIEESRRLGDPRAEADSLVLLAAALARDGRPAEARDLCGQALEKLQAVGAEKSVAEAQVHLSSIELDLGECDAARGRLEAALAYYRSQGLSESVGRCQEGLGIAAWKQGRLQDVRSLWQQALEAQIRAGNRFNQGTGLRNLAVIHTALGDLGPSYDLYLQALSLFRQIGALREEGVTLTNLGFLAWTLQRPGEAEAHYRQALELQRSIRDRRFEGLTLSNLAALHGERGELDPARDLYRQALERFQEVQDRLLEASSLRDQSLVERRLSLELDRAEHLLEQALALFREHQNPLEEALCCCEAGHLALARGNSAEALLLEAEKLGHRSGTQLPAELQTALDRLREAIRAAQLGQSLFRGERIQDLPTSLRLWLELQSRTAGEAAR